MEKSRRCLFFGMHDKELCRILQVSLRGTLQNASQCMCSQTNSSSTKSMAYVHCHCKMISFKAQLQLNKVKTRESGVSSHLTNSCIFSWVFPNVSKMSFISWIQGKDFPLYEKKCGWFQTFLFWNISVQYNRFAFSVVPRSQREMSNQTCCWCLWKGPEMHGSSVIKRYQFRVHCVTYFAVVRHELKS